MNFPHDYEEKLKSGATDPVVAIAEEENLSRARVRDILHDARRNRFLTKPARKGVAEGKLTEEGWETLRAAGLLPAPTDKKGDTT